MKAGDIIDGRFVLLDLIGRGGMGQVWRARQNPLGRLVALKVLREEYSMLPHLRRRFAREARAAARLGHEHVCSVYDFGAEESGRMFLAMEYVQGSQLIAAVRLGMTTRQVVELASKLLEALAHAHARGVVHRDLKPENVLMAGMHLPAKAGEPKIVDFGIATLREERDVRETSQDQVVGTPLYMSPEQASGERNLSPRTDIYSLGLILYELLAGEHPFESEDAAQVMADQVTRELPALIPRPGLSVPEELERILLCALQKNPSQRWEGAAQMRAALEPVRVLVAADELYASVPHTVFAAQRKHDAPTEEVDMAQIITRASQDTARALPRHQIEELAAQGSHSEFEPALTPLHVTPFMGRAEECEQLLQLAEGVAKSGEGRVVLMDGDAGMGKTRLMMWLKETLEERGQYRGHIGVFPRSATRGMLGLQEIFESIFRTRAKTREQILERLHDKVQAWGEQPVQEDIEQLADFLRPDVHEPDEEERPGGRIFALLGRMLEMASRHQPRLILLDDAHWASGALVDFLEYMASEMRFRRFPVLFVATMQLGAFGQSDHRERWQMLSRFSDGVLVTQHVAPMDEATGRALIQAWLPVDDALATVVSRRSAGNPLYMVLLLRFLGNDGALQLAGDGIWHARDIEAVEQVVPPSLADLFKVRLQQIDARHASGARLPRLLARAAILGRRFSYDVLEMLCELEEDGEAARYLARDFDALLSLGLITEVVGREDDLYMFRHGLMRDVVLMEEVGPAQRRGLHRFAAQALELVYGARAGAHAAEIAVHWRAGKKIEEAIEWFWRAAQTARRSWRQRDALASYRACAELMDSRLGQGWDEPRAIHDEDLFQTHGIVRSRYLRALVYAADLEEGFGAFSAAETIYRRVVRICGKPDAQMEIEVLVPLCQTWLGLGHIAWQRGDFTAAHWAFERVHEWLDGRTQARDIDASALRGLARVAWHRGEYERATQLADQAMQVAIAQQDREGHAESLWILGEVARMLSLRQRAEAYFEESFVLYREAQIPTGTARNLLSQAQLARFYKDFEGARAHYEQAARQYESLGDRRGRGLCYNGLGEISRFEGDLEGAMGAYLHALEILQSIGAQYDVAITCTNIGLLHLKLGDLDAAEDSLQTALTLVVEKDYPYLIAGIGYNLALIHSIRGKGEEAQDVLRPLWAMHERVPIADLDFAEPLEQLGRLRAQSGDLRQARALLSRARETYKELSLAEDAARLDALLEKLGPPSEHRTELFEETFIEDDEGYEGADEYEG